jgi:hypothetical protein
VNSLYRHVPNEADEDSTGLEKDSVQSTTNGLEPTDDDRSASNELVCRRGNACDSPDKECGLSPDEPRRNRPFLLAHDLVRPRWRKTSQQGIDIVAPLPGTTAIKPWFFCLAEKYMLSSNNNNAGGAHSIEMMML